MSHSTEAGHKRRSSSNRADEVKNNHDEVSPNTLRMRQQPVEPDLTPCSSAAYLANYRISDTKADVLQLRHAHQEKLRSRGCTL
jgi:hypothetical protein